jgi:hypothetical protein
MDSVISKLEQLKTICEGSEPIDPQTQSNMAARLGEIIAELRAPGPEPADGPQEPPTGG